MPIWSKDKSEVSIKIALVGQAGVGKRHIIQQLAFAHGHAPLRTGCVSETEIARTAFIWPEPLPEGPFVKVRVFALTGQPHHDAAEQVMLMDADAVIFVVDCDPHVIGESRDRLLAMMTNADHIDLDWQRVVVVMQYHRAELYPNFKPDDLDQWLGIVDGKVARFITSSDGGENICVAVDDAVNQVMARLTDDLAK